MSECIRTGFAALQTGGIPVSYTNLDVYKRQARRLVHECCNYDSGNCLLLEDGEPCVCVQSISYSLLCRWFTAAVLPLDEALEAALLRRGSRKRCAVCRAFFSPKSNRDVYKRQVWWIVAALFLFGITAKEFYHTFKKTEGFIWNFEMCIRDRSRSLSHAQ